MTRIHEQLDELVAARDQLQQLVRVIVEIGSDLDLDRTLHRIVSGAMQLTGARYGSVGLRANDGSLSSFIYEGISDTTSQRLGGSSPGTWCTTSSCDSSMS